MYISRILKIVLQEYLYKKLFKTQYVQNTRREYLLRIISPGQPLQALLTGTSLIVISYILYKIIYPISFFLYLVLCFND